MHELGHFLDERKQIERLRARASTTPASSLPISLSSATIATSRAHDFSASSIILRCRSLSGGSLIPLEHAQVAADDAGGRAELVNGEREQWRIRFALTDELRRGIGGIVHFVRA